MQDFSGSLISLARLTNLPQALSDRCDATDTDRFGRPEPFQAFCRRIFKIFRSPSGHPLSWPGSRIAALRRNNKAFRVRVKPLRKSEFACVRTIGISSIDQIHAELDSASQNFEAFSRSGGHPQFLSRQTASRQNQPVTMRSPPNFQVGFVAMFGALTIQLRKFAVRSLAKKRRAGYKRCAQECSASNTRFLIRARRFFMHAVERYGPRKMLSTQGIAW